MYSIARFGRAQEEGRPKTLARGGFMVTFLKQSLAFLLVVSIALATAPAGFADQTNQSNDPAPVQSAQQTPEQLQQLVAPIALYPDELVAQILAASTYPTQVVVADRWIQDHPSLKGQELGDEVNKQPWDPSVKALAQFPSVLANMDKNLSWTSSLGDAYVNQQQQVMDAVQAMRQRAQQSGNLKTTPQQTVTTQGKTIIVEPADPEVVYVPAYDPWLVYGGPIIAWPGWYPYPGIWYGGPYLSFGVGFGIGFFGGYGWGWHHWGSDWHNHTVIYNHNTYISHSRTFVNRNNFGHGGGGFHGGTSARGFGGGSHGFESHQGSMHSGAFSGFDHGGVARGNSSGGRASMGGGFHGGGGLHGGGGFHGGGGRR
jgi:Protein of unknown function (DUF3300)